MAAAARRPAKNAVTPATTATPGKAGPTWGSRRSIDSFICAAVPAVPQAAATMRARCRKRVYGPECWRGPYTIVESASRPCMWSPCPVSVECNCIHLPSVAPRQGGTLWATAPPSAPHSLPSPPTGPTGSAPDTKVGYGRRNARTPPSVQRTRNRANSSVWPESLALVGNRGDLCLGFGIQVGAALLDGLEGLLIQLVHERNAGRNVDAGDVVVGNSIKMLDDGAQ